MNIHPSLRPLRKELLKNGMPMLSFKRYKMSIPTHYMTKIVQLENIFYVIGCVEKNATCYPREFVVK